MSFLSEQHRFEFYLPPGSYKINAYGREMYGKLLPIEVPEGFREVELNPVHLPPSRLARLRGRPAPEFSKIKAWKNSKPLRIADLRGRFILLDFWGFWCGPCIAAMPEMMRIHDALADEGLMIVAVHDDSIDSMQALERHLVKFTEEHWDGREIPFPIAIDGGGETDIPGTDRTAKGSTTAAYGVQAWPTTILIGPDGNVIERMRIRDVETSIAQIRKRMVEQ